MRRAAVIFVSVTMAAMLMGCGKDLSKESDAKLGLNAQQSEGRRLYDIRCLSCHPAYSTHGGKGPGLAGLFKRKYFPSGLPANDRFARATIMNGRGMMPAAGYGLTDEQLDDLIAYLHTL